VAQNAIVISQVYGGGGNSGAPFRNDFIELFNRGNVPVDLSGWSIQYASATSSSWSVTTIGPVTLAPGKYLLIQQAGGSAGATLPTADVTGTINLASTSGKVALASSTTALSGACPGSTVDLIGYGANASCFEGSGPAPAPSNTLALQRSGNGCVDSQNNSADFATGAPQPRNTATPAGPCQSSGLEVDSGKWNPGWFAWLFLRILELGI
jgi:predicted extracellular nuclease